MLNSSTILPVSKSDCYSGIMDVAMSIEHLALRVNGFFLNRMFACPQVNPSKGLSASISLTQFRLCKRGHKLSLTVHRLASKIWWWAYFHRYPNATKTINFDVQSKLARSNRVNSATE